MALVQQNFVQVDRDVGNGDSEEHRDAALAGWDTGGIWPNFGAPHDEATALGAYGERTLARLAAIAKRYDPDNVLAAGAFARRR